ncbi:MAG TPA: bacillithiol biosynthesis deacetylase BshB1 [Gemmatimonadaceae bacterium]|jgi:bacillithiol biosynthesis deacetylase BshB1|nr:bacillithiol biosynthesis deacetylase BshB1 [Gemmatimonadaceae bacterium]
MISVLAVAAHRDDVELTCGGTLLRAAAAGHTTGILDLTEGEMGTRGSAELRAQEAARAAEVLGVSVRENLGLPDAGIVNTPETRRLVAVVIRRLRPRIVIAPALMGRHPDHRETAMLVRDACFVAGLKKIDPDTPAHRPLKVIHCVTYREDFSKPTFVVDISDVFEKKLDAIRCYGSQFEGVTQAGEVYPNGEPLFDVVRHHAAHYGSMIRTRYGEPYFTYETMRVDDIGTLGVSTF